MRITTLDRLAAVLHLAPSSLASLRHLSLDDVAQLNAMIEQAQTRHREQMRRAVGDAIPFVPARLVHRLAKRGDG